MFVDINGSTYTDKYVNSPSWFPHKFPLGTWVVQATSTTSMGSPPLIFNNNSDYLQSYYGIELTCLTSGGGGDTTPPSITVVQTPSNISYSNVFNITQINATITDNVKLDNATINITIWHNYTQIFINGSLQNINVTRTYDNAQGSVYQWLFDEQDLISATHNLNPDLFENTTNSNITLQGANNLLKMEFINVTNNRRLNYYEIMSENASAPSPSNYYYCNSSYSTGNPATNSNCALILSADDNNTYNHIHAGGKSKHKVYTIGINVTDGKVSGVFVTSLSYIVKQGSLTGDLVFYLPITSRTTATATSTSTGSSWHQETYTINSHLHSISYGADGNESFMYIICAKDNSSNKYCSPTQWDIIDVPLSPPNAVTIYSPIQGVVYNGTLLINHSQSFSATGQTIINYTYDYRAYNTSTDWTFIAINSYPYTSYLWDISNILNGHYDIRVTVRDSLGYTATSIQDFNITNVESITNQLLQQIIDELKNGNTNTSVSSEAISMLWVTAFIIAFFIFGFLTRLYILWALSGIGFGIISLNYANNMTSYYANLNFFLFLFLCIGTIIAGVMMQILYNVNISDKDKEFYPKY